MKYAIIIFLYAISQDCRKQHWQVECQDETKKDITRAAQFKARTEAGEQTGEREPDGEATGNHAGGRLGTAPQEYEALGLGIMARGSREARRFSTKSNKQRWD